jgi:hypothetical protein
MISEAMVSLEQTVDLSCTETNTISKWTETKINMTHVTLEFYLVRPNGFQAYTTYGATHAPIMH